MLLNLSKHSPEPLRSQITRQVRSKILSSDIEDGSTAAATPRLCSHPSRACAGARTGVRRPQRRGIAA
jgi:hypothetical protein